MTWLALAAFLGPTVGLLAVAATIWRYLNTDRPAAQQKRIIDQESASEASAQFWREESKTLRERLTAVEQALVASEANCDAKIHLIEVRHADELKARDSAIVDLNLRLAAVERTHP